jgi:hypothetical protein
MQKDTTYQKYERKEELTSAQLAYFVVNYNN